MAAAVDFCLVVAELRIVSEALVLEALVLASEVLELVLMLRLLMGVRALLEIEDSESCAPA